MITTCVLVEGMEGKNAGVSVHLQAGCSTAVKAKKVLRSKSDRHTNHIRAAKLH